MGKKQNKQKAKAPGSNPAPNFDDDEPKVVELPDDYDENADKQKNGEEKKGAQVAADKKTNEEVKKEVPSAADKQTKVEEKKHTASEPTRNTKVEEKKEGAACTGKQKEEKKEKSTAAPKVVKQTKEEEVKAEPMLQTDTEKKEKVHAKPAEKKKEDQPVDPQQPEEKNPEENSDNGIKVIAQAKEELPVNKEEEVVPQGDCVVCGQLAKSFCSGCKHIFYCTRDHQKQDWKNHKEDCNAFKKIPYRIERNHVLGRFLVATADLPAGQLIFNENPILVGPRQLSKPVCLGCHKELKGPKEVVPCSRCTWPLCSKKCENSSFHEPECRILKYGGTKIDIENYGQINMMYACITVLRALALKTGPQKIWQEYTQFESHLDERMKTEVYQKVNKEKIVFFIHHYLKLLSKYSDLEILESCGRLDTNCFELRQDGLNLRALYRIGSIISHDCTPNTKHTFNSEDYSVNFYATVNIPKGSIIKASYTQQLWCTYARRDHLWMSKCFWCECARCRDPTEFGTELSALICSKCGGRVMPTNPLDQDAPFKCKTCGHSMTAKQIKDGNASLTDELRKLDRTDSEVLEDFLKKYATILPDTHQLVREVQYGIVCLFKAVPPEMMSNNQLLRKSNHCKQLLALAKKIDPGLSKWRGELLFQLQTASVVLAQRSYSEGRITKFQAQEIFEENLMYLREAITILQVEPEGREELQKQMEHMSKLLESLEE